MLARCARTENRERTRYGFHLHCHTCASEERPAWIAEAVLWLAGHLHHRTVIRVWKDPDAEPEPTAVEARHEAQRQGILAALGEGDLGIEALMLAVGISESTARARLRELEAEGDIFRLKQGGRGRGNLTLWRL